jgi:hypothetical protein
MQELEGGNTNCLVALLRICLFSGNFDLISSQETIHSRSSQNPNKQTHCSQQTGQAYHNTHMDEVLTKYQERRQSSKMFFTNQGSNVQSSCFDDDQAAAGSMKKVKASTDKTKTLLPEDFTPSEYSVICGNKRTYFNSVGNSRFRVICKMHAEEFRNAQSKHEKSYVVSNVMKILSSACPVGSFVTLEKGRWWEVSDRTAREKVGTFFRDLCGPDYKSSSKSKIAQRKIKRKQSISLEESSEPLPLEAAPKSAEINAPTMPEGPSSLHNLFAPNSRTAGTAYPVLSPFMSLTASLNSMNNSMPEGPSRIQHLFAPNSRTAGTVNPVLYPCTSLDASLTSMNNASSTTVYSTTGLAANSYEIATSTWEQTLNQAFTIGASNVDDEDGFSSSSESVASFYDVDSLMPSSLEF